MIFKKPDVIIRRWDRNVKEAYIWDSWGLSGSDTVQLAMRSRGMLTCAIDLFKPMLEARVDDKEKQTYFRGKHCWLVTLKDCKYV